jgi:hypothetical protein
MASARAAGILARRGGRFDMSDIDSLREAQRLLQAAIDAAPTAADEEVRRLIAALDALIDAHAPPTLH